MFRSFMLNISKLTVFDYQSIMKNYFANYVGLARAVLQGIFATLKRVFKNKH
jgi:hypothetical protein